MAEIKCPCGLRDDMEHEDCQKTNCDSCCPLAKSQTNADSIRAMSDEELARFLYALAFARETPWSDLFVERFCKNCPTIMAIVGDKEMQFNECDFADGECPNGSDIVWWLKQPSEVEE